MKIDNLLTENIKDGEKVNKGNYKCLLESNHQNIEIIDDNLDTYFIDTVLVDSIKNKNSAIESNFIKWHNVFENVDIEQTTENEKIKEIITVKDKLSQHNFHYKLVASDNLEYKIENEEILFISRLDGNIKIKITKPVVKDSENKEFVYKYRLSENDLYLETEGIEGIVYPLFIDPSYLISKSVTGGEKHRTMARQSNGNIFFIDRFISAGLNTLCYWKTSDGGQSWGTSTMITAPSGFSQYYPQICVDGNDALHVVFISKTSVTSSQNQVCYISSTSGETWGTRENLTYLASESGQAQNTPKIIVDSNNILHIVWYGSLSATGNSNIRYVSGNQGAWSDIEEITRTMSNTSGKNGTHAQIAIDSNNITHIVWSGETDLQNYQQMLHVSGQKDSRSFFYVTQDTGYTQTAPYITEDSSNNIHCIWRGTTSASNSKYDIKYSKFTYSTSTWGSEVYLLETSSYNQNNFPVIMRDRYNNLNCIWTGYTSAFTGANQIRYINYINATSSWGTQTDLTSCNTVDYGNLGVFAGLYPSYINTPVSGYAITFLSASLIGQQFYYSTDYNWGASANNAMKFMTPMTKYW
jgi:hypothetical protein